MTHLGFGDGDQAKLFKSSYPCFVYAAQTSGSWNNSLIISQVEELKKKYRIDTDRIYLIGYSMGGSGSYSLANAYFDLNEHLFAEIIRLAGQSQTSVRDQIAKKTSIWLHIRLKDSSTRVSVTRKAYDFLKNYHTGISESSSKVTIDGYSGETLTLKKDGIEIVKKTEYNNVGHGVSNFPFKDEYLLEWLFDQNVDNR